MANNFGDTNEAAIARWGVAVCRDLVKETQAWGDTPASRTTQIKAIAKDANRAVFSLESAKYVNRIATGKLRGLHIRGQLITFTPNRILKTPQQVVDFMDLNRTTRKGRVPKLAPKLKGVASQASVNAAIKIKGKRAGVAKGGWIGAGISIGSRQMRGSRITIGTKVAGYSHKFKSGGTSKLTRSTWNPVGEIKNNVGYVSTEHVLKKSASQKAINEGGRKTVQWYEHAIRAKLRSRR